MNKTYTITIISAFFVLHSAFGQGSLTPPGAPAPTMKTLAQIEPRTPISSLPYSITNPGSYYFTGSLTNPGIGNGITIGCSNVTIDLNGFTLQGIPTSGDGIFVNGSFTNLVFRNGAVNGWGSHGIDAWSGGYPRNTLFEKLTVSANGAYGIYAEAGSIIRECSAIANANSGFYCQGGELIDCLARENNTLSAPTGAGFTVVNSSLIHCDAQYTHGNGFNLTSSQALDCNCFYNSGDGFICEGAGNQVSRCRISFNSGIGVDFDSGTSENVIENCLVANNTSYGLYTSGSSGSSTITGNTFDFNSGGAIIIGESNDLIENNHAVINSGDYGISITDSSYTNIVVVKNVVVGGGANNYSNIGGTSDFGPVGTAASSTSPFANISH